MKEREFRSLVAASEELSCDQLTMITWDEEREENYKGKKIQIVPLWKWLLFYRDTRECPPFLFLVFLLTLRGYSGKLDKTGGQHE
ncbi:MAG: hypothetical protein PHQ25_03215 [Acidobacteriota bacterium]|nr:hypothetical protein [Acidobacteriota bacterium]MDW3228729.1 hypothetical protein [Acidobacteriota bacterium]